MREYLISLLQQHGLVWAYLNDLEGTRIHDELEDMIFTEPDFDRVREALISMYVINFYPSCVVVEHDELEGEIFSLDWSELDDEDLITLHKMCE